MTSLATHSQKSKGVPPTTVVLRFRGQSSILYFPDGFSFVAPVKRIWIEQMSESDNELFPRHHPSTCVTPEFIFQWIVEGVKTKFKGFATPREVQGDVETTLEDASGLCVRDAGNVYNVEMAVEDDKLFFQFMSGRCAVEAWDKRRPLADLLEFFVPVRQPEMWSGFPNDMFLFCGAGHGEMKTRENVRIFLEFLERAHGFAAFETPKDPEPAEKRQKIDDDEVEAASDI